MFGPIVHVIGFARSPVKTEWLLTFAVPKPMEAHVYGFGAFGPYLGIDNAFGHGTVGLYACRRMSVTHFL